MKCLLVLLLCCVVLANTQFLGLIERYCMSPKKRELNHCAGRMIVDIYKHCGSSIKYGITGIEQLDEFMCSKMDYMEYHVFQGCFYGSMLLHDRRGENLTKISEACLKKHEPPVLYDWRAPLQTFVTSRWKRR